MDYTILIPFGAGLLRSVSGWLENALEDGKISQFEWGQLGSTVINVAILSFGALFGLSALGFDVNALSASALGILGNIFFNKLKK
jgi:small-conductance mechanosensitive channel